MNKNAKNVATVHTHTHTHTHTDVLDKNKNKKIYERDIYKNASNCGVQNNSAITLVALVITVIVLLILAGVTLNMVMGENGIINKAQLAKNKTNQAQEQENKMLNELEQQIDSYTRSEGSNSVSIYKLSELDSTYNPYGLKGFIKYDKSNEILEVNLYYKKVNIPNLTKILNLDFIENLPTLNLEGQDIYVPETADYMAGTGMTVNSGWTGAFLSLSTSKNIYIHNTNGAKITEIGPFHCEMYLK